MQAKFEALESKVQKKEEDEKKMQQTIIALGYKAWSFICLFKNYIWFLSYEIVCMICYVLCQQIFV